MKSYEQDNNEFENTANEPVANYQKAELDLLRAALKTSYTERFDKMMSLIKMGIMFRNAKITPPDESA